MPTDKKISELPIATSVNASDISLLVNGDTDYQYTFTLLLQFLQANLTTGANLSFGTILPQNTTGKNGDVFVNTSSGSFAQKVSGAWTVVYTLPAADAANGTLLYGAGLPASALGKNLDSYINTLTGIFYKKAAGTWSQVFSMATGPQGPQGSAGANGTNGANGNTILSGTTNPSNSTTGVNGNFYINTSNYTFFGPKMAGIWGDGVSLLGTGVPNGGTAGQVLVKVDGTDFNADWQDNSFANLSGNPADNVNLSIALAAKQNNLDFTPENTTNKNQANGYAGLDGSGKVAATQLPSYVDDVLEFTNYAALPITGETGKIYVTLNDNAEYRWSGSTYIQLVASPGSSDAVTEGSINKYFTAARVLATVLTGIGFSTATAVLATDTILQGIGKLQAQITALFKIPTGGTAGQILAKIDGTGGNTHWIDAPTGGGGGSGYATRASGETLTFDVNFKMETIQTDDIEFTLDASPVSDVVARIIITGDGVHGVTFPTEWVNANGQVFDNQQKNVIYLEYDGTEMLYSIVKVIIPDTIPPYIVSATIENTAKSQVELQYSEPLDAGSVPATGDFSANLSKAVSSVVIAGSIVTVTMSTDYANGDVPTISYTPGGNPVRDVAGNVAAALDTYAVTNNVNPARESVSITTSTQLLKTTVKPVNLIWGNAGVDTPVSVSFWIKRNNTGVDYLFEIMDPADPGKEQACIVSNTGIMTWFFVHSGAIVVNSVAGISADTWTHVVFTYDGSGLNSGLKIYFNNTLQSVTNSGSGYVGLDSLGSPAILSVFGRVGNSDYAFNIQMVSLYFWNKELSSSEISLLYNSAQLIDPTTLAYAANLKAQYEFNGNANDSSASGYNLSSSVAPSYSVDTP
jgi:hypothetical protein